MSGPLWVESLLVSADTQVRLIKHGSHSPGQLFSLSLVGAEDGWSSLPLSKAGQLIQEWWLPCNFWMVQSPCSLLNENNYLFRRIVLVMNWAQESGELYGTEMNFVIYIVVINLTNLSNFDNLDNLNSLDNYLDCFGFLIILITILKLELTPWSHLSPT